SPALFSKALAEKVAFLPARAFRRVGDAPRDFVTEPGKARRAAIIDRQGNLVAGGVIVLFEEFFLPLITAAPGADDQKQRRRSLFHKRIMVGTGEEAEFREMIGRKADVERGGGRLRYVAERRSFGAQGDDVDEIRKKHRHVEIDIGDDLA